MTNMENFMLTMCFSMNLGWLLGGVSLMISEGIKTIKEKRKAKKEQQLKDSKRTGDNL